MGLLIRTVKMTSVLPTRDISTRIDNATVYIILKGQSHQDLVVLENSTKVLVLIGNPLIVA